MEEVRSLIHTRKPGVQECDIVATENVLKASFPPKYRQLIQLINQAEIEEWILYAIKDSRDIPKTFDDIIRNNNDTQLPDNFIAFAEDGTGDLLCFMIFDGEMEETVFYWNHEDDTIEPLFTDLKEMILTLNNENL